MISINAYLKPVELHEDVGRGDVRPPAGDVGDHPGPDAAITDDAPLTVAGVGHGEPLQKSYDLLRTVFIFIPRCLT